MAEPILNRPRVVPFIGERAAAGVAQHVDMEEAKRRIDAIDKIVNPGKRR
ncbi:MAG: hypothetical protein WAV38_05075 [Xanthobacteraceae bacterium]